MSRRPGRLRRVDGRFVDGDAGTMTAFPRLGAWPREAALFLGAYLLYSLARGVSRGSSEEALANAAQVVAVQARLGLNVERAVQDWATAISVTEVLGWLYLVAQLVAVPLALAVVYRRRRSAYPVLRSTLLGAWLIAIPIYALFPTAPPRLAGIGIADVVSRESLVSLDGPVASFFYNPVAAVPSLHAAFAVAIGVGVSSALRNRLLRVAALFWGPLVIVVVVATGNHFVLDVVAGLVVVGIAFAAAVALHGMPPRRATPARRLAWRVPPPARDRGPLRIAVVCPYAWDSHGGVATHVRGLAATLRARGHAIDVLAPADRRIDEPGFRLLGRTVGVPHNGSVGRVALGPRAALRSLRAVRRGRYDVVHLHEPLVPSTCLVILLFSSTPCVGTFHMYGPESRIYRSLAPLGRVAARRLRARIAVSEAARDCARMFLGGDYEVVPNGVHPVVAAGRPREERGRRVLFVGRPDIRKGLPVLLRALPLLSPSIRLDLVGVTPAELRRLASGLPAGTLDCVHAHGPVTDELRLDLLSKADILCAPSVAGESFGLVLVEAMAAGVPVVASAIPGYVDVVPPSGVLVPPGDPEKLAAAINELADDPDRRRRLAVAGRRAAEEFGWDRVVDRLLPVYRRVHQTASQDRRELTVE